MKNKFLRVAGFTLLLALMLAVSGVTAQEGPKVLFTSLNITSGEPSTLDPQLSQDTNQVQVENEIFPGLNVINEVTADTEPGTASSWDVSEDGLTTTFHIMENLPWVRYNAESGQVEQVLDDSGSVRYLTASDYVYSYTRALEPATADPYAYVLAPLVVGGEDFNGGVEGATAEGLGIRAVDDYTFEVVSPVKVAYAATVYGMYMARAVPQWVIEAAGNVWVEPENINSYGPFALKEWAHNEYLTLIKNPFWPGTESVPSPRLDEVTIRFLDPAVQFTEYLAGGLDASEVPLEQVEFVKSDPTLNSEFFVGSQFCSYYYGFNQEKAPMDNIHLRLAFSYAVDRQTITDNVTHNWGTPARWFSRPGLVAAPTMDTNPDLGIGYDPTKAQEELQLALDEMGLASVADLPPITLAFNENTRHAAIAQAIQQMWTDTLGITVQVQARDATTYFEVQREDADQIFRAGWCLDYPDASNFARDVMRSDSSQNYGHFNNAEYDALVDEAITLEGTDARRELYVQAEQILVAEDPGMIPILWYTTNQIVKPYVERTYSIVGIEAYEKWDIQPH